jgi:hypothetical protein
MSFGFEGDDDSVEGISQAIREVDYERGGEVIFLAAASNNSTIQTNMFPARHPSVIPIHATDSKGKFIFNPSTTDTILGTFGKGLPDDVSSVCGSLEPRVEMLIPHLFFYSDPSGD